MKKKSIILMLILLPSLKTLAQSKIDKFCTIEFLISGFNSKNIHGNISFGKNKWLFHPKDSTIITKLSYVNSLDTYPDILNYMSKNGWSLLQIDRGVMFFKKAFDASDFMDDEITR